MDRVQFIEDNLESDMESDMACWSEMEVTWSV